MRTPYESLELAADHFPGKSGPNALFIHALMGQRQLLNDFTADWRWQYGATLNVDLPGHGATPMPREDISIEATAAAVISAAQKHNLCDSVLIGQSMGALVAIQVAALAPELASAVVLLDPAPIVLDSSTREGWAGLYNMMVGTEYQQALDILIDAQSGPHDEPRRVSEREAIFRSTNASAITSSFASMLSWNGAEALAAVKAPILGIWAGRNSEPDVLLEYAPHALCGQVIASGHYVHTEAYDQVWAMLRRFVQINQLQA